MTNFMMSYQWKEIYGFISRNCKVKSFFDSPFHNLRHQQRLSRFPNDIINACIKCTLFLKTSPKFHWDSITLTTSWKWDKWFWWRNLWKGLERLIKICFFVKWLAYSFRRELRQVGTELDSIISIGIYASVSYQRNHNTMPHQLDYPRCLINNWLHSNLCVSPQFEKQSSTPAFKL